MCTPNSWHRVGLMTLLACGSIVAIPSLAARAGKPTPPAQPPVQYALTTLPLLDGSTSCIALGMNNVGDVVGLANVSSGPQKGWLYSAALDTTASLNDRILFPAPIDWLPESFIQHASDINDYGEIAATAQVCCEDGIYRYRAVRYEPGIGFVELDVPAGYAHCYANAINKWGDVVGEAAPEFGSECAVLWPAGGSAVVELTDDGPFDARSALDINDACQIVGRMRVAGYQHAFRFTPDSGIKDLGVLPRNTTSYAYSINSSGQVAGRSEGGKGGTHAFRYTDGVGMKDLGALSYSWSTAKAIDDSGHVAGVSADRAFLYTDTTGMIDLLKVVVNAPAGLDAYSVSPTRMNRYSDHSFGEICGGLTVNGVGKAFVMTPDR